MPSVDDTMRGDIRDDSRPNDEDRLPPGDGDDRLGPLFGSLPPDVLREVLLPKLCLLSRACFALSAGACLRAVKDAGLSWQIRDVDFCSCAAFNGYLELLRYAHEHGCAWDSETCVDAAAGGHLECLQYAHAHDCPWDWESCAEAAEAGGIGLMCAREDGRCADDAEGGTGRAINTRTSTVLTSTFYEISGSRDGDSSSDCG